MFFSWCFLMLPFCCYAGQSLYRFLEASESLAWNADWAVLRLAVTYIPPFSLRYPRIAVTRCTIKRGTCITQEKPNAEHCCSPSYCL
ncbi:hypothetical protein FOXYSP1_15943 [Fusarium oxysporum f. sp. phaseoli]